MKTIVVLIIFSIIVGFIAAPAQASHRNRLNDKIDDLDNDIVEDLAIPVLFGVRPFAFNPDFGAPRDGGTRLHEGQDIVAPEGTPIVTPTEAVVIRVDSFSGAGKSVITANPGDERFYYYHLEKYAEGIDEGDVLEVGDPIGYVGDTGNAAGGVAHLHFEIREDGDAKDPYPRITKEFSIKDKIEFLDEIIEKSSEEDELAEFLVEHFLADFIQARALGIELPEAILDALPLSVTQAPSGVPQSDLSLGSSGTDVILLQSILISKGFLSIPSPTGTFGPLTQAALISYQSTAGLPATGYYGPLTRASLSSGTSSSDTLSREQILAQIAELTRKVQELQALLN